MADSRTLEQITKENEALEKELAALRAALGLDRKEADEQKARIKAVFEKYDVDKSGSINRAKFDLLAYEVGAGVYDEKSVSEIFSTIAPKDPSAITLAEFEAWFAASKSQRGTPRAERKTKPTASLAAAAKLQTKALLEAGKHVLSAAKAKVTGAASAAVSAVAGTGAKPLRTDVAGARDGIHVRVAVGDFKDVAVGVALQIRSDAAATVELKRDLEVPEGKGSFAFIDVGIMPGADEGKLGELAGVLEGLLGALGGGLNEKAGIPVYHGHTVKIAKDKDGDNVLRVAFFADLNPTELLAAQLGRDAAVFNPAGLVELRVALETPVSLSVLHDPSARLTLSQMMGRLTIDGTLAQGLDARVSDAVTGVLPEEKVGLLAAAIRLFRGLNLDIQAISLDQLVGKFDTPVPENPRQPHEILRHSGLIIEQMPLSAILAGNLAGLAAMGSELPAEIQGIYNMVRALLTGPKLVHAQVDDLQLQLQLTGCDLFKLAPAIGTAE